MTLMEAFDVRVDNAVITGESLPQVREAGAYADDELLYARNILLAGTSMVSGQARAVVFATGMQTQFRKIAYLTQSLRCALVSWSMANPTRSRPSYAARS
jgi:magnesium-transporting ATPase (P-type)